MSENWAKDEKQETKKVCLWFKTPSGCKSGSNCKFTHLPEEQHSHLTCRFYNGPYGCLRGGSCAFRHEKTENESDKKNRESAKDIKNHLPKFGGALEIIDPKEKKAIKIEPPAKLASRDYKKPPPVSVSESQDMHTPTQKGPPQTIPSKESREVAAQLPQSKADDTPKGYRPGQHRDRYGALQVVPDLPKQSPLKEKVKSDSNAKKPKEEEEDEEEEEEDEEDEKEKEKEKIEDPLPVKDKPRVAVSQDTKVVTQQAPPRFRGWGQPPTPTTTVPAKVISRDEKKTPPIVSESQDIHTPTQKAPSQTMPSKESSRDVAPPSRGRDEGAPSRGRDEGAPNKRDDGAPNRRDEGESPNNRGRGRGGGGRPQQDWTQSNWRQPSKQSPKQPPRQQSPNQQSPNQPKQQAPKAHPKQQPPKQQPPKQQPPKQQPPKQQPSKQQPSKQQPPKQQPKPIKTTNPLPSTSSSLPSPSPRPSAWSKGTPKIPV